MTVYIPIRIIPAVRLVRSPCALLPVMMQLVNIFTPPLRSNRFLPFFPLLAVVFDYDRTTMYLYGGLDNNGNILQDLWKYNISTDTWTQMTLSGSISPAPVGCAVEALSESATKRILVYGGWYYVKGFKQQPSNDLWLLQEGPGMYIHTFSFLLHLCCGCCN